MPVERQPKAGLAGTEIMHPVGESKWSGGLADRRLGALSGGQRQRTLIAQGLAQRAELLLLDEAAAGLDPEAQQMIEDAVTQERAAGVTVVRITHDMRMAELADHCLVLADGRAVAEGTPATALAEGVMAMTGFGPSSVGVSTRDS